jgi:uncharacterized surface protein with fasciclin (FAS1) repeats
MKRFAFYIIGLIAFAFFNAGCTDDFSAPDPLSGSTLQDIISENEELNIFTALAQKTGLSTALDNNNAGTYTVFAPKDSAFLVYFRGLSVDYAAYNESDVLNLIATLTSSTLPTLSTVTSRMNYHIVSSSLTSDDLVNNSVFTTLNGARLSVSKSGSEVVFNAFIANTGAKSVTLDGTASNGVLHIINRFMNPPSTANVLTTFGMTVSYSTNPPTVTGGLETGADANDSDYDIFSYAIRKGAVAPTLLPNMSPVPELTIFAPKDIAFKSYLAVATEADAITALKNMSADAVAAIVKNHVISGSYVSTDLTDGLVVTSLAGNTLTIHVSGATITIEDGDAVTTDATITSANILTNTGIIHQIDKVLID